MHPVGLIVYINIENPYVGCQNLNHIYLNCPFI